MPESRSTKRADVAIVGAGLAGLVVARELRRMGLRAVVAEARDRVGGRAWTTDVFGERRDVGATFVHWAQPHVWAEVTRYGLPVSQRPPVTSTVLLGGGERHEGSLGSLREVLGEGMDAYCADSRILFPRPYELSEHEDMRALDRLTMADRIADLGLGELAADALHGFWSVNCSRPCEEAGLLHALHLCAAAGGDWRVFNEACARYKLADGLGALIEAIRRDADPEILLADPVAAIEQTDGEVVVRTVANRELRAGACVVTVPLNVLSTIEFTPALSEAKQDAAREGAPVGGFKLWLQLERVNESYLCMASGHEPLSFLRSEATSPYGSLFSCYGTDADRLAPDDAASVAEVVRAWLPDVEVTDVWGYDWARDEFAREMWRVPRPAQWTRHARELREPEGRVLLAGADYARGWCGFLDGAVESGVDAARRAAAIAGRRRPDGGSKLDFSYLLKYRR